MAVAAAMAVGVRPATGFFIARHRTNWVFTPLALSSSSSKPPRKLILYSKPGCCLCDGLKEKLQSAFLIAGPDSLHDVDLEVGYAFQTFLLFHFLYSLEICSEFDMLGFV